MYPEFLEDEANALPGAFSRYDMMAVYPSLIESDKDSVYLEVGVMHGRSLAFVRKYFKGEVYGIDRNNELEPEVRKMDVHFIHAHSNDAVKNWTKPIDVLFIDGDHTYEGAKADWDNFSPFVKKGGIVFFHDCDKTSPGVVKLFNEITWEKGLSRDLLDDRNTSIAWARNG